MHVTGVRERRNTKCLRHAVSEKKAPAFCLLLLQASVRLEPLYFW